ncbi:MAG: type I pantothenate kinase [Polyangiaceae bacterium]|nr:type I pantothenate kinase [Polyangiaceae bacterium]
MKAEHAPSGSLYTEFSRASWARLRGATPLTVSEADLARLRSADEHVSLEEVSDVYLPLSRLLDLYVAATSQLSRVTDTFLGSPAGRVPYVIAIAGSVAGGKSTTARILRALIAEWPNRPRVELVTTDGFLHPNRVLEERGILGRKGFPESYDVRRLIRFLADLKSGVHEVRAPVYSHHHYDVLTGDGLVLQRPDIVIIEGLNVLQTAPATGERSPRVFVSDFIDFSIYIDASEDELERWYVSRFMRLRETAFRDPESYFKNYAKLTEEAAAATASDIWRKINLVNLRENIGPTRERARLILEKGTDHRVERIFLRKL